MTLKLTKFDLGDILQNGFRNGTTSCWGYIVLFFEEIKEKSLKYSRPHLGMICIFVSQTANLTVGDKVTLQ